MTDRRDRLTTLLTTTFDLAPDDLTANPTLADLEFDSLSLVRFETAMEKEFGIPFDDDELTLELTVDAVLRLLDERSA
jgi:acyl carrier protein